MFIRNDAGKFREKRKSFAKFYIKIWMKNKIKKLTERKNMTSPRTEFVSVRRRQLAAAGGGAWGRNQNLTPFASRTKLGPVANAVLIALLVALLGLLYLTQLTRTSTFSYQMNTVNDQKAQLTAEQDNLKVENARLESLARVKSSSVAAAMTNPVNVTSAE